MTNYVVPTLPTNQLLTIDLAGTTYQLLFLWNGKSNCWVMDVLDSAGNPIVTGIPLITGADLLEQYHYLGIGGSLLCQTIGDIDSVPTYENFGTTGILYFIAPT